MQHLALNVYLHDPAEQAAFVTGCLEPALRALRGAGALRRAWFGRFDARGPHVYTLVSTDRADEARATLADAVDAWLAARPALETLDDAALELRHGECRGKQLNAIDAQPGFAAPGTYAFAPHAPPAYPFAVFAEGDEAAWALLTEIALANAAGPPEGMSATGAALRWMAGVDLALGEAGVDAADYWRYHTCTLLPGLPERLRTEEAAVLDALPRSVGERNLAAFTGIWESVEAEPDGVLADRARRLVRAVLAGREPAAAWPLLREANHCGLLQMGQMVRGHLPILFFAWHRNLRPAAAA